VLYRHTFVPECDACLPETARNLGAFAAAVGRKRGAIAGAVSRSSRSGVAAVGDVAIGRGVLSPIAATATTQPPSAAAGEQTACAGYIVHSVCRAVAACRTI